MSLVKWKNPGSYFGYDPTDDYLLLSHNPSSSTLEATNFSTVKADLEKCAANFPPPPDRFDADGNLLPSGWVHEWEASGSVVEWIAYLMVRGDAPQAVVDEATRIMDSLEDYPVWNEDAYSEAHSEAIYSYWTNASVSEREEYCVECEVDLSAAQCGDVPQEIFDYLMDCGSFA